MVRETTGIDRGWAFHAPVPPTRGRRSDAPLTVDPARLDGGYWPRSRSRSGGRPQSGLKSDVGVYPPQDGLGGVGRHVVDPRTAQPFGAIPHTTAHGDTDSTTKSSVRCGRRSRRRRGPRPIRTARTGDGGPSRSSPLGERLRRIERFRRAVVADRHDTADRTTLAATPPFTSGHTASAFAARCPRRLDPIATSVVHPRGVEDPTLHGSGRRPLDETPVLDPKPHDPDPDHVVSIDCRGIEIRLDQDDRRHGAQERRSDSRLRRVQVLRHSTLGVCVLSLTGRPARRRAVASRSDFAPSVRTVEWRAWSETARCDDRVRLIGRESVRRRRGVCDGQSETPYRRGVNRRRPRRPLADTGRSPYCERYRGTDG
jgi:hypothetical protein